MPHHACSSLGRRGGPLGTIALGRILHRANGLFLVGTAANRTVIALPIGGPRAESDGDLTGTGRMRFESRQPKSGPRRAGIAAAHHAGPYYKDCVLPRRACSVGSFQALDNPTGFRTHSAVLPAPGTGTCPAPCRQSWRRKPSPSGSFRSNLARSRQGAFETRRRQYRRTWPRHSSSSPRELRRLR